MSTVTVEELDGLLAELKNLNEVKDAQGDALKETNKQIWALQEKAGLYLGELDRTEYDSPHGKIKVGEKWRVNLPPNDLAKGELFEHLRQRGIFDKFATVNSNSLNALYMADWREAEERGEGMTFQMPGIEAPKCDKEIKFKPSK